MTYPDCLTQQSLQARIPGYFGSPPPADPETGSGSCSCRKVRSVRILPPKHHLTQKTH